MFGSRVGAIVAIALIWLCTQPRRLKRVVAGVRQNSEHSRLGRSLVLMIGSRCFRCASGCSMAKKCYGAKSLISLVGAVGLEPTTR